MKNIYKIVLSAAVLLVGCTKDESGPDVNPDWIDEDSVSAYCNEFYEGFSGYGEGTKEGDSYFKLLSDDQAITGVAKWTYTDVPSNSPTWNEGWKAIRRANLLLEKIADVPMSEARQIHWTAVGRLMRGWHYYHLVRMYGNLPWTEHSADISKDGYLLSGARIDRDIVMSKVLADLNYACTNTDENNSKTTFNRAVANAMKAEICLYEGTFRKYRSEADGQKAPDTDGASDFLEEAKKACTYITAQDYRLNDSYQGNYNSTDLSSNPEMIFYKDYAVGGKRHSLIAATSSSVPIFGMSKDAFESYLFRKDGKPVSVTSETNINDLPHKIETGTTTVYSIFEILKLRDARLGLTIDTAQCFIGCPFIRFASGLPMTSTTGYGICKYDNKELDATDRNVPGGNYTDAPLFWLSVVYLQYAEACAELAELGAGSVSESDLAGLNELRARAQLPDLLPRPGFSDPKNTIGVSDLLWEIRRERRCELMFDNNTRYWDLVRWHQLNKLDTDAYPDIVLGVATAAPRTEITTVQKYDRYYPDTRSGNKRTYDKKYYLYPIPSGQLTRTPGLGQNPEW